MNPGNDASLEHWLAEVQAEYWSRLGEVVGEGTTSGVSHVLFDLAGRRFVLDARDCKGVVRRPRITRLPGLPRHCLGVAGVRGEVVSVVDLAAFLGLQAQPAPGGQFLLIVAHGDVKAALSVDRILDVTNLDDGGMLEVDVPWVGLPEGVLVGEFERDGQVEYLLDSQRLLESTAVGDRPGERDEV